MHTDQVQRLAEFVKDVSTMSLTGPITLQAIVVKSDTDVTHTVQDLIEFKEEYFVAINTNVSESQLAAQLNDVLSASKCAVVPLRSDSYNQASQLLWQLANDGYIQYVDPTHGVVTESIFPPAAGVVIVCTDTYLQTSPLQSVISMAEQLV